MSSTVVKMFADRVSKTPDAIAFRHRVGADWNTITWQGYGDLVRRAAAGLRALGIDAGDKVAILSGNRYEWHVGDIATESCGGVTVPIYPTNSPPQVAYIAGHSESKAIFVENAAQLAKIEEKKADLPSLTHVVVFDPTGVTSNDRVITWDELLAKGDTFRR